MPQPGLFGLEERYARLNERDPLVKYGNITFPHSGNDNSNDNRTRVSDKPGHPFTTAPPLLDSSFRWNDDGGRNGFVTTPIAPLLCLTNI